MIYLLWLLPVLVGLILYLVHQSIEVVKLSAIALVAIMIYTLVHQAIMKDNLTRDTEWWGNYAVSVHYYDDWDEEVPCRHPIYCTRYYECGDGKTSRTCSDTYVCGYEHSYDVDYHPEYWSMRFDNGQENTISRNSYLYYCELWGNKKHFVELNRDYHSNDGNDVACDWNRLPETSETMITEHNYENRVQASTSVFKAAKVDTGEVKKYKLFEYPLCVSQQQPILLGIQTTASNDKLLRYINGFYGSRKQFKLFICCWFNQSEITAEKQHSYWNNLNKNEFLVCLGLNKDSTVQWCKTYSWMDRPVLSVKTEQFFRDNKKLNLYRFANWLPKNIQAHWSRKHFRDFKYLKVELTQSQYTIIFIVVFVLSILQFIIINKIARDYESNYSQSYRRFR